MERQGHDNIATAARIAGDLPGLLLDAQRVAHSVMRGLHGRRRTGQGETFWQFRHYQQGDASRDIDWRQTAKRDDAFVRQMEWEAAQSVWLYRDATPSMQFRSSAGLPYKKDYAEIMLLALGMILLSGGEQVGLLGGDFTPQAHESAIGRIHDRLPFQKELTEGLRAVTSKSQAVLFSDFYMPLEALKAFCLPLAARQVRGVLVQICDPAEESLPYHGRLRFENIENTAEAETIPQVEAVRDEYHARFQAHRAGVSDIARLCGWRFLSLRTDEKPEKALSAVYNLLQAEE